MDEEVPTRPSSLGTALRRWVRSRKLSRTGKGAAASATFSSADESAACGDRDADSDINLDIGWSPRALPGPQPTLGGYAPMRELERHHRRKEKKPTHHDDLPANLEHLLDGADSLEPSVSIKFPSLRGSRALRVWRLAIIDPTRSSWLDGWDIFLVVLLVLMSFLTPYETAFLTPRLNGIFAFDRFVDVCFLVDMVIQCVCAYPDPKRPERMVKAPWAILKHYLTGAFLLDALSLLPIDICCVCFGMAKLSLLGFEMDLFRLRLLRLVRLLRLMRFQSIFDRWHTSFGFSFAKITLFKFISSVVLCCHWMACMWGGLAMHAELRGWTNWLAALRASKGGEDELYEEPANVYVLSLYWAIITLTSIGYGDITPQCFMEYWVATVCASIMAALWAYVIGSVCSIVSSLNPHELHFKRTMDDLNDLLVERDMPQSMCSRLRKYFHEAREMNKQQIEEQVIEQMSPMLQGECAMFLHQRWIKKVWYLRDMGNRDILIWAARNLTLMIYASNEEILEERTLFIVRRGVCAYRSKILVSGDIWGEDMLLSNEHLRDKTKARALSYLSVLRLHVADLFDVVVAFPEAKARLRWAQVRIATMRGIILLGKTLKRLRCKRDFDFARLPRYQLSRLYGDILNGVFNEEDLESYRAKCPPRFRLDAEPRRPSVGSDSTTGGRRDSPRASGGGVLEQLASHGNSGPLSSGAGIALGELLHSVAALQDQIDRLEDKVDQLPAAAPGGPPASASSRRCLPGAQSSRESAIDFGSMAGSFKTLIGKPCD